MKMTKRDLANYGGFFFGAIVAHVTVTHLGYPRIAALIAAIVAGIACGYIAEKLFFPTAQDPQA
jgi:ABC-type uncharacterized transport system permease subunit